LNAKESLSLSPEGNEQVDGEHILILRESWSAGLQSLLPNAKSK
jgi:hypothetical protein